MSLRTAHVPLAALRKAINLAAAAVPSKTPMDVLKCVRITFGSGSAVIQSYSGVFSVSASISGVDCDDFAIVVPADKLSAVASTSGDEVVRFDMESPEKPVTALVGRSRYTLPTTDPKEFPAIGDSQELPLAFTVDADEFRRAVHRTAFLPADTEARYALGGVCLDWTGDRCTVVAADGRRLSCFPVGRHHDRDRSSSWSVLPPASMKVAAKLDGEIGVRVSDRAVAFTTAEAAIRTQLIEGLFPKYRQIIRTDGDEIAIASGPLLDVLRQALRFMPPEKASVELTIAGGEMTVRSGGDGLGACELAIPVSFDGWFKADVNPTFLIDFASRVEAGQAVLRVTDGANALVFESGEWTYVAMPIVRGER